MPGKVSRAGSNFPVTEPRRGCTSRVQISIVAAPGGAGACRRTRADRRSGVRLSIVMVSSAASVATSERPLGGLGPGVGTDARSRRPDSMRAMSSTWVGQTPRGAAPREGVTDLLAIRRRTVIGHLNAGRSRPPRERSPQLVNHCRAELGLLRRLAVSATPRASWLFLAKRIELHKRRR